MFALELSDPVVVSRARPSLRYWGPWQFPGVQRLPDGRLSVWYHVEADSAVAYGSRPGVAVSDDEGESWRVVPPREEGPGWGARMIALPNGDLLRQVLRRSVDPATVAEQLPPPLGETGGGYGNSLLLYDAGSFPPELAGYRFARLPAGGDTWVDEQATVNVQGALRAVYMGVLVFPWIQRIVLAPDGSLWGINHGKRIRRRVVPQQHGAMFLRSTDNGRTWELLSEIPYWPCPTADPKADERDGFTEPNVAFLPDGSVLCLLRTTDGNGVGPLYCARSLDDGHTWSRPAAWDDCGVWPALLTLSSGVTLAAYGRPGLYVRGTDDPAGRLWSARSWVVAPKEHQRDTCSYADMLALNEREALIVYSDFNWPDARGEACKSIMARRVRVRST